MKQKLKCILLVDDDEATNFVHKILIRKFDCAEKVIAVHNGKEALDYLKNNINQMPELVLTDINMPAMSGWEFLEEFEKSDPEIKNVIVIVMLTTSLNPDDRERAKSIKCLRGYESKPLTSYTLERIFSEHFPNLI